MTDFSKHQHIGVLHNADYYLVDGDIILIVPGKGFKDNPLHARESVKFQDDIVRKTGKKCGDVIVMSNVLSQDAESRRIYNEQGQSGLYYGVAIIVDNALSRALASFIIGMSQTTVPIKLFDTIDHGIDWLRSIRPQ